MSIKLWPAGERPREKLLASGATSLGDAELLAIFLRSGLPGRNAVDLARDLLHHFGSLRALLAADIDRFTAVRGVGRATYVQLQAVRELAARHLGESLRDIDVLDNAEVTRSYLSSRLRDRPREVFVALYLDIHNRLIAYEELAQGTIDSAAVYPREVVRAVLRHNAAAVIFAHNHPSGRSEPSQEDRRLTMRLCEALDAVDVRVLDHLVIGDEVASFVDLGLL